MNDLGHLLELAENMQELTRLAHGTAKDLPALAVAVDRQFSVLEEKIKKLADAGAHKTQGFIHLVEDIERLKTRIETLERKVNQ